jgi:hypothetical protein
VPVLTPEEAAKALGPKRVEPVGPAWANTALQGTTLGFGDELVARARSTFGNTPYDQAVAAQRGQISQFRQDHPVGSTALEIAGSIPTALVPGGGGAWLLKALGWTGRAKGVLTTGGRKIAEGAIVGTGEGAIAGAGAADDNKSRLEGAWEGGKAGGILGAGLGGAMAAAPKVGQAIQEAVAKHVPEDVAAIRVQDALLKDGLTPQQALQVMRSSPRAGMETLADVAGENTRQLAETAVNVPSPGRAQAREFYEGRQATAGDRIKADISTALGKPPEYFSTVDAITQRQKATAKPLYDAAYAGPPIPTQVLGDLINKSAFKNAYVKGVELLDLAGELPPGMPPNLDAINPTQFPVAVIDIVKKGIDGLIDDAGKGTNLARALGTYKREILNRVDPLAPDYAKARAAFAGDAALLDAAEAGRQFLTSRPGELERSILSMNPSELEAFRMGAMEAMGYALGQGKDGANQVRRIFGTPNQRAQLQAIFPDKQTFDAFQQSMNREIQFAETKGATLGNSATAVRLAGQAQLAPSGPPITLDAITQRMIGAVTDPVGPADAKAEYVQKLAEALARLTTDPKLTAIPQGQSPAAMRSLALARALSRTGTSGLPRAGGLGAGREPQQ